MTCTHAYLCFFSLFWLGVLLCLIWRSPLQRQRFYLHIRTCRPCCKRTLAWMCTEMASGGRSGTSCSHKVRGWLGMTYQGNNQYRTAYSWWFSRCEWTCTESFAVFQGSLCCLCCRFKWGVDPACVCERANSWWSVLPALDCIPTAALRSIQPQRAALPSLLRLSQLQRHHAGDWQIAPRRYSW